MESNRDIINEELYGSIDLEKLKKVLLGNWLTVLAIMVFCLIVSWLVIRYSVEIFESRSELKLDIKKEASALGIGLSQNFTEDQNINNISGEIELIRSKLFFKQLIQSLDMRVTYFTNFGTFKNSERFNTSPFEVDFVVYDPSILNKEFEIEFEEDGKFVLSWVHGNREHMEESSFGSAIKNEQFLIKITPTEDFARETATNFSFVINSEEALMNYIQENLKVEPVNLNANTISISFQDPNRSKAYGMVRAIDSLYLRYTQLEKRKANQQKIEFLDRQLEATEQRLENYEDYFEQFTIENKTLDMREDISNTIVYIQELDSQKIALQSRIAELGELSDQLSRKELPIIPGSYSEEIDEYMTELLKVDKELSLLLGSYNDNTFAVRKKKEELSHLEKQLKQTVDRERRIFAERLADVEQKMIALEGNFIGLPSKGTEFTKSQRFYQLYEEFFLSLMQRKAEYEIEQAGTVTNFVVLSEASLPDTPISPNKLLIYVIGIFAGLLISFFFLGTQYLLHNKINSLNDLERMTGAPILGMVPNYTGEKLKSTRMVIEGNSRSMLSEALRTIRTNMEFMSPEDNHKIISITSTISGEGKTFIAVNLGAIFALSDKKVIVVDLDMRKPKIHHAFQDNNGSKGISTILIKKNKLEECIHDTRFENLKYLTAGPVPPNPSELLLTDAFSELLDRLKEMYDLVILDTPPAGLVTDGVLVIKKSDLPIYVFKADYSKKDFVKSLNRLIEVNNIRNMSVILNGVNSLTGYGYGYGKSKLDGYYIEKPARTRVRSSLQFLKFW